MPRAEWTLAAALLLAGCATAPPYHPPSVAAPPAYKYGAAWRAAQPGDHLPRGEWWRAFADPELDALMTRADSSSQTLAAAVARPDQAAGADRKSTRLNSSH